jgi:hypothetical protein
MKRLQNGGLVVIKGSLQNVEGEYKVNIMGREHEDENGVKRLEDKNGKQIVKALKSLEGLIPGNPDTKLAKVTLMSCFSNACGASGTQYFLRCIFCVIF